MDATERLLADKPERGEAPGRRQRRADADRVEPAAAPHLSDEGEATEREGEGEPDPPVDRVTQHKPGVQRNEERRRELEQQGHADG